MSAWFVLSGLVLANVFLLVSAGDLSCYKCENMRTDGQCNRNPANCTAESSNFTRCLTVTKLGRFVDKRCATPEDCKLSNLQAGELHIGCCKGSLCNKATSWPSNEVMLLKSLEESIGMMPSAFISQITVYQLLSGLIYASIVLYIIKNIPRGKPKSRKVSPDTGAEQAEEVVSLHED